MVTSRWPTKKIGEICEIVAGQAPPSEFYNTEGKGKPFLKINSFGEIYPKVDTWTTKSLKDSRVGDVLFSVAGSLGFVNLGIDACITRSIFALRLNNKQTFQKYLFYLLKIYGKKIADQGQGSAQKIITINQVKNFQIPLPSLPIQQKVVGVLDTVRKGVEAQDKIIELTKELKKSLMAKLFREGAPSFRKGRKLKKTEIGEIPEDWEVVEIKKIGRVVTGSTPSTSVNEYWNGNVPFVTPSDFNKERYVLKTERTITEKGEKQVKIIPQNSVMVVCIGSTIGKISLSSQICVTNQQINSVICNELADPIFVYYTLFLKKELLRNYAGTTAKPILKKSLFEQIKIPLPSRSEQREIAKILQTVDQKIEIEQKKKALYEELFKTMLNKLMMREIEVEKLKL